MKKIFGKIGGLVKGLLSKALPLDRILAIAGKLGLIEKPLSLLGDMWGKAQGVRTQGSLAIASALAVAASVGWVEWDQVEPLITVLVGAAGPAFLDKVNRVLPAVKAVSKAAEKASDGQTGGSDFRIN